ncbi:ArnT family glycosyltransferase [Clostridium polynesiense]|uniref:ArnT family glycosyltransferase n=1 Tax=Clostridium polynesiense TaxID=1325933 RepID=UPI000A473020|nr:glycosyltransferase family 39 protein [Clostridium polynesiense]
MYKEKANKENNKTKLYVVMIIALYGIIAAAVIWKWGNSTLLGSLETFNNDDAKYIRSAWTLMETGVLTYENPSIPTAYIMPGLSYVLAAFFWLFGKVNGLFVFRIFQILIQCGSLYLIFLIAKKIFNEKVALIACILDAVYMVEIYVASLILMESMVKFLFLLLIYISIHAIEKNKLKLYAAAGVVWSLLCMFRPPLAAYPLIILIIWIKNKYSIKDIMKYTSLVFIIFCCIMSPWWIRNYREFNKFIPFTASSGNPFLQGTFINYDQSGGFGVEYREGDNFLEKNKNEMDMGIDRLKKYASKEPIKYFLWYTIGKTYHLWNKPFYWENSIGLILAGAVHYIVLLTAVLGIIQYYKNKHRKNIGASLLFQPLC